jgi:hypothetical protein
MTDRAWVRSLPLLLMSTVLFLAGALMFFRAEDSVASIASMTAGVLAFGAWTATAVIDWYEGHPPVQRDAGVLPAIHEVPDDPDA